MAKGVAALVPSTGLVFAALAVAFGGACGNKSGGFDDGDAAPGPGSLGRDDGGDAAPAARPVLGHLTGKVLAPEGTIPISGALVYLTARNPEPQPDGVFCDTCVKLTPNEPYVYSAADGTFSLPAYDLGAQQLVVQKGLFRRVRPIDVAGGDQPVARPPTTLPGKMDRANGDEIPKMAIVQGAWDKIENSLAKLGLGEVDTLGRLKSGTESFDIYAGAFPGPPKLDPRKLITTPASIDQYNIVFIPCSGSNGTTCTDMQAGEGAVKSTLGDYVAKGGKLYVTDYSYEYVRQIFPGYVTWEGQTSSIGSACQTGAYDADATIEDKGLGDWLSAAGNPSVKLLQSWTTIQSVNPVTTTNASGSPVTVTPKVWLSANKTSGKRPATVSFERGCGRVLFSTYHTEGDGSRGLLAQEEALLYVLLEVGVCVGELPPPPPPR
jgi:hypothetical protein